MKAELSKLTEFNLFRNIIVGKDTFIPSWTLYKRVLLTGQIALFGIFYTLLNVILGYLEGITEFIPYYAALGISCIISILILRNGSYVTGRVVLILTTLLLVSLFVMLDRTDASVYFFYFVITIGAMTIFGYERITLGILFSALVIVTFLFIFSNDFKIAEAPEVSNSFATRIFGLNFVTAVLLSVMMIYYMILINYQIITDLRRKEEDLTKLTNELSESRNRFELAIKGSSAGIWDWDPLTDSLYLSPLLTRILGYTKEDIQGASQQSFYQVLHPDDLITVREKLDQHLNSNVKFEVEFRIRKKDGEFMWVLDTGQAEWNEKGQPVRMVGSIVDISERKKAESMVLKQKEELEKANKELDRFVYSVSHDLKSPLSSVLGLITITEMSDDLEEVKKCVGMMRSRIDQLNKFIEEIIEYARNTRKEIHHNDRVVIRDLVNGILENLAYLDNRDRIDIQNNIDPSHVVSSDESRLKIILNNLIGNAIKYHDYGKEYPMIRITSQETGDGSLRIIVADNGTGIEKELQERVFEMFYRASETSDGSGLGLYIAREMIENLQGSLSLESEKGKGSEFTITIPLTLTAAK
ncbi:sensor histidine kinase [Fulvivirga sedimenti]|uniref:histidine kinase n=1 Tax=Fulvivirga sedimenti TaxID=2879465 RepID=A0A9X1HWE4_9BACT|nr:PAS domain-containing sensor histidine kinase [Fulvivirga sedimenti]MCA6078293.1 PAS domain-containing protein [Fulvivirga sedimenti]